MSKIRLLIFLFLLLLGSAFVVQAAPEGEQVVVRVHSASAVNISADLAINYDSYQWLITDSATLEQLNAPYQIIPNAYTLTLGEQSFDPLVTQPSFPQQWQATANDGLQLHLVQFDGPTKTEWLAALEQSGVEIVQYIHPFTYIVWGDSAAIASAENVAHVRWVGKFAPAYAVLPQWRGLSAEPIRTDLLLYRGADTDKILDQISAEDIEFAPLNDIWAVATLTVAGDQLNAIAHIAGVVSIQPISNSGGLRGELTNQLNVGNYNGSNQAFPGYNAWLTGVGLDGNGVIIANVDGGIQDTHPDLVNRMAPCTGSTCGNNASDSHGTHTAGIMAADGSSGTTDSNGFLRGLGVAPGANLVEQRYFPTFTQPNGMLTLMYQSYDNGALLSGNSWGPEGTPHGYDNDTMQVDIGVRDADPNTAGDQAFTYVLSFMNGGGGTSTQGTPDEAKNLFNIGSTKAQQNNGNQILDIDDLSANTAHGPALDGRTIPHMVAPGCNVDSTVPNNSYGVSGWCGTSMASPHVSGGVALFIEYYRNLFATDPSPALIKAAFLPVAHDLAGNRDADNGTLGHPFDSKQGWGRMDLAAVVDPSVDVLYFDNPQLFDNTGEEWTVDIVPVDANEPVRMMLVWTDAAGHGMGGSTPAWNNDLDLTVEANSNTYRGNNFNGSGWSNSGGSADSRNNTEGIFMGPTPPSEMTITVTAANISSNGLPGSGDNTDQDFALACYNCELSVPSAVQQLDGSAASFSSLMLVFVLLTALAGSTLIITKRR